MSGAGIEIRDLSKRYVPRRGVVVEAIRHLDLSVAAGAFLAIVGPSGCGKSTLLHLVAGLEEADAGRIVTFGVKPDRAAIEYGYISPGDVISGEVKFREALEGGKCLHAIVCHL